MPFTVLCNDGDIRLEGGSVEEEGRVEVCLNEAWGTVCDDLFTAVDANVVCGQLRYSRYSELYTSSFNAKCSTLVLGKHSSPPILKLCGPQFCNCMPIIQHCVWDCMVKQ